MESVKLEVMEELQNIIKSNLTSVSAGISSKSDSSQSTKTKTKSVIFVDSLDNRQIQEICISDVKLKPVKDRLPTPTVSLENLVAMVLESITETPEIPSESNALDLIHLSKPQKLLMERNCLLFKKLLKQNVLQRCLAGLDLKTMHVIMKINTDLIGVDQEYLVELIAESIIRLPTEDIQFGSNLRFATNVLTAEILIEFRSVLHEARKCKEGDECLILKILNSRQKSEIY